MKRLLSLTVLAVLLIPATAQGATPKLAAQRFHITATNLHGLSAVSGMLRNLGSKPIMIYRVSSTLSPDTMLHYDVNMCDKGRQMNVLPMVIIPPHSHIKLSTRGLGAMLYPVSRTLTRGSVEVLTIHYRISNHQASLRVRAEVVRRPKRLIRAASNSVG